MVITSTGVGFEQGPIRPPSEAASLLIRLNRNCPWNKCTFCPVYKGTRFSLREVDDIIDDIDVMARMADAVRSLSWKLGFGGEVNRRVAEKVFSGALGNSEQVKYIAYWLYHGGAHAFLQDANSLVMKPADIIRVLEHVKKAFPHIERITTYARAATAAKLSLDELQDMRNAGLTRVHIGLESGSDEVLKLVRKGATQKQQIEGGRKVVEAGLELSEYIMPGLGGKRLTTEHARETALCLSAVNPHFIRIRSFHAHRIMPIYEDVLSGDFELLTDDEVVSEIRRIIEGLEGIESYIASDHILNLLEEVEGQLPGDTEAILGIIDRYLGMDDDDRLLFRIGRRAGFLRRTGDLDAVENRERALRVKRRLSESDDVDIDTAVRGLMNGYI
ncbi:MAG: radical SAM protein [Deltaproteobacteria bacterium]|nr:radical SAM protein [Candidatus Zymogenaceae bacterium]